MGRFSQSAKKAAEERRREAATSPKYGEGADDRMRTFQESVASTITNVVLPIIHECRADAESAGMECAIDVSQHEFVDGFTFTVRLDPMVLTFEARTVASEYKIEFHLNVSTLDGRPNMNERKYLKTAGVTDELIAGWIEVGMEKFAK